MKNIRIFYLKNCHFLVVKFSVYFNRRVFIMCYNAVGLWLPFFCFFFPILKVLPFFHRPQQSKESIAMTVYLPIYTFCFPKLVISILSLAYFRALYMCFFFFSFIYLVTDKGLTLKTRITTAAENNFTFIFYKE